MDDFLSTKILFPESLLYLRRTELANNYCQIMITLFNPEDEKN